MRVRRPTPRWAYTQLFAAYGPQGWWPARSRFEILLGAILTQGTAWRNVEQAIAALRRARLLSARAILHASESALAECLRPSGYFNVKARRLRSLCRWYLDAGGYPRLARRSTASLRAGLLEVYGVGPETADDILLYGFERPVFVIDAYTRRLFARLDLARGDASYDELQSWLQGALRPDARVYNEFHALIVRHAKVACRPTPDCAACPLRVRCVFNGVRLD